MHFEESIKKDIRWLNYDWKDREFYASDYFEKLYEFAVELVKKGKAYVDELSSEEIREYRGTLKKAGKNSPYRDRPIEENLALLEKMKNGEFKDGEKVLRAKIDMSSPNMNMRDPVMYRIKHLEHNRTKDKWCIYPTYDFTHGQSDAIENITHSLCTLEFEDHRPLYNWFLDNLDIDCHPQQIEFARLNINYTVLSKRKLTELVEKKVVEGWDDPRLPTISGLRRRGYTPESIKDFCNRIGVAKNESVVDVALLEHCLREDLNKRAQRVMGVLDPIKVIITNYPEDKEEELEAINNPEDKSMGKRTVPFCREIYIERKDFMENPPKKFFRLYPGKEVRLRYAYYITCNKVIKDKDGEIKELHCSYDPESRGGWIPGGRKVKGTLHWVSARHALKAKVNIFDNLFTKENPNNTDEGKTFLDYINPDSKKSYENAFVEPFLKDSKSEYICQFERQGYFCVDKNSTEDKLVFNRSVSLRDTWARIQRNRKKQKKNKKNKKKKKK